MLIKVHYEKIQPACNAGSRQFQKAFTLIEVVISMLIVLISLGGIISVYTQAAVSSDWSAHSLSAQMMALYGLEQCRGAKYDPRGSPPTDELVSTNFPTSVDILDLGTSSGLKAYGTNTTTITTVSTNPAVKLIRVDCVWSYPRKGIFTNSVFTYRAPNQ